MRLDISRNTYGDKINYIARDVSGKVRIRANTLRQMEAAIAEFNKRKKAESLERGSLSSKNNESKSEAGAKNGASAVPIGGQAEHLIEEEATESVVEGLQELGEMELIEETGRLDDLTTEGSVEVESEEKLEEKKKTIAAKKTSSKRKKRSARVKRSPQKKFYGYRRGK